MYLVNTKEFITRFTFWLSRYPSLLVLLAFSKLRNEKSFRRRPHPFPSQASSRSTTNVVATAELGVHIPHLICQWERTPCSGMRRQCAPYWHDDPGVRLQSQPQDDHRLILTTVCCKHMGKDRLEQITRKDSVAYLPTILLQLGESKTQGTHPLSHSERGSRVSGGICEPCKDRRQYCLKVMTNEPFRGKEVDSVIHSDRAS